MDSRKPKCICAIDVGTYGSGGCISFVSDPERFFNLIPGAEQVNKVKTAFLLEKESKRLVINTFGDAAVEKYLKNPGKYFLFKQFKMELYRESRILRQNPNVTSVCRGYSITAIDAFGYVLKQFFEWTKTLLGTLPGLYTIQDVSWVVTVPAIWSDGAKDLMVKAAQKAEIPIDQTRFMVCLEPTAASLWSQRIIQKEHQKNVDGLVCLTIDAGGGTIDSLLYKIESATKLRRLRTDSGGNWGSTFIDQEFERHLKKVVGEQLIERYMKESPVQYEKLKNEFVKQKEAFDPNDDEDSNLSVPSHFVNFVTQNRQKGAPNFYEKKSSQIRLEEDTIVVPHKLFLEFFDSQVRYTTSHVRKMLQETKEKINFVNVVGGFSKSPVLFQAIKDEVKKFDPSIKVIRPPHPGEAIVCGAAWYGMNTDVVTNLIKDFTYGISSATTFDPKIHREDYKFQGYRGPLCDNIFNKFFIKDQSYDIGTEIKHSFVPTQPRQTSMAIRVMVSPSERPFYTTEENCNQISSLTLAMPIPESMNNASDDVLISRSVTVTFKFDKEMFTVNAKCDTTGNNVKTTLNYFGEQEGQSFN